MWRSSAYLAKNGFEELTMRSEKQTESGRAGKAMEWERGGEE